MAASLTEYPDSDNTVEQKLIEKRCVYISMLKGTQKIGANAPNTHTHTHMNVRDSEVLAGCPEVQLESHTQTSRQLSDISL